jgi:CRP/FNR family cyclic AMP-dependent transcriptional regulator
MADPKLELLRGVHLFAGLSDGDLRRIEQLTDEVEVPTGTVLTQEGRFGHEFFVIVDGAVRVEHEGRTLSRLGPGDFLGEIALVDGRPRSATVTTEEPTRLLVLAQREFHTLLESYPKIQLQVLRALAERVRSSDPDAL